MVRNQRNVPLLRTHPGLGALTPAQGGGVWGWPLVEEFGWPPGGRGAAEGEDQGAIREAPGSSR